MSGHKLIVHDSVGETALEGARALADAARRAVRTKGRFSLALAGGTTPRKTYEAFAELPDVPWGAIDFYFGDERAVPRDDPESNYRLCRESLFDRQSIEEACIFRMAADADDLDAAARDYEAILPRTFDLVLLGMGEDGHTASIFPGSPTFDEPARKVMVVTGPKPPPRRLTVTPPVLEAALDVIVLVTGSGKAPALARALEGPSGPTALPVQIVKNRTFLVDRAAASKLARPREQR
jgi:6-phosphogluconolactonase